MVIIPLLVIELKATPNGNPSDDFYWRQKSSSLNVVQIIPQIIQLMSFGIKRNSGPGQCSLFN